MTGFSVSATGSPTPATKITAFPLKGVEGSRWASPSSKRLLGQLPVRGWVRLPCTSATDFEPEISTPVLISGDLGRVAATPNRAVFRICCQMPGSLQWQRPGLGAYQCGVGLLEGLLARLL